MAMIKRILKGFLPPFALDVLLLMRRHRKAHGRVPNIFRPRTFNEKILWRNLFDQSPLLTQFVDKFAVRAYVESKVGAAILPRLFWVTTNPSDIPFADLPNKFVVKPTHGAGWVRLIKHKDSLDQGELINTCRGWLAQSFYQETRERVYRKIPPRILIEELICPGDNYAPDDYKFYVFGGRVEMIELLVGRFQGLRSKLFDRSWNELDVAFSTIDILQIENVARPKHLEEMISVAEALGQEIEFVRVDLYNTEEKIYFGEMTVSPGAGLDRFEPVSFDTYLGSLWRSRFARS
jgi:hypothetical protein